jgi:hypothetical protein
VLSGTSVVMRSSTALTINRYVCGGGLQYRVISSTSGPSYSVLYSSGNATSCNTLFC